MTQGIRAFTLTTFKKTLPQLNKLGNTEFRRTVMNKVMEQFGIEIAPAATHYNYALKTVREEDPKAVEGLGRPDDKKGGRPVLHPVTVIKAKSRTIVAEGVSRASAQEMVKASQAKGKVKLAILEDEAVEA